MLKIPLTKTWVKIIDTFDWQVSIHLGNWSHVLNYVNKAENTSELAEVRTIHKFSTKSILLLLSGHVFKEIILLHEVIQHALITFLQQKDRRPNLVTLTRLKCAAGTVTLWKILYDENTSVCILAFRGIITSTYIYM